MRRRRYPGRLSYLSRSSYKLNSNEANNKIPQDRNQYEKTDPNNYKKHSPKMELHCLCVRIIWNLILSMYTNFDHFEKSNDSCVS